MKLYLLLPVHNRRDITRQFLHCLQQQTYPHFHLVLIDDGSTDGTAQMVQEHLPKATIIRGKGNWWWAGSLQQGINWLKQQQLDPEDVVLMVNDDLTYEPDFLERGMNLLTTMPRTLLLAECYSVQTGQCVDRGITADLRRLTFEPAIAPEQINCLATRGLFLRWADLQTVGDFHPRLLPHYLSDYEFTIRAARKGLQLRIHPDLKVWLNEKTTGYHEFEGLKLAQIWKRYFSRKSSSNKIDWTIFVWLVCPWSAIPSNLVKVWAGGLWKLFHRAV